MAFDSEATGIVATNSIFIALAALAVVVRLFVRKTQKIGFKADDYLIVVALALAAGLNVTNIVGVPVGGFGVPFPQLSDETATQFLKILFVQQFWYIFAVAFVKFSVLCFYGRIFTQQGRYPIVVWTFIGVVVAWLIAFFFATLFQVYPIWCNWNDCPAPITDYSLMYALCSATDIALDIGILCIPVFFIRKLQLSSTQKFGLIGIFGIGLFCVVASTVRLIYTVIFIKADPTVDFAADFGPAIVQTIMWSGIEACASIICANLPTYWPLVRKSRSLSYIKSSWQSMWSSQRSTSKPLSGSKDSSGPFGHVHGAVYRSKGSGTEGSSTEQIVSTIETTGDDKGDKGMTWLRLGDEGREQSDVEMGVIRVDTRMSTNTK